MTQCLGEAPLFIRLAVLASCSPQRMLLTLETYHKHKPYFPSTVAI